MLIQAGYLGVDYSFARPSPTVLAANGVRFVSRYLSAVRLNPKNVTRAEVDALHEAGIGVLLNFEQATGDVLGGAPMGEHNAALAVEQAVDLGYPPGLPIIYSFDTGPQQRATAEAYYRAAEAVTAAAGWTTGLYAGIDAIAWADADGWATGFRWQATAWSTAVARTPAAALAKAEARWPGGQYLLNENFTNPTAVAVHAATHVLQHYGRVEPPLAPIVDAIDENVAFRPFATWLPGAPTVQEDTMIAVLIVDGAPAVFIGEAVTMRSGRVRVLSAWHLADRDGEPGSGEAEMKEWLADGADTIHITRADMGNVRLLGAVPPGWSASEFRAVAGEQGPKGDPGPAGRDGAQGVPGAKGDAAILTVGTRLIVM